MSDQLPYPAPPPARRGRRTIIVAAAVAAVVVGGFVAVYLLLFTDDSPDRFAPSERSGASTSAPASGAAAPTGRWMVAEGSEAGYRVREKLASLPAKSDAVGRTTAVTGGMTVAAAGERFVARDLRIEVDLTQLRSDEARRDNRIRTLGLESTRFPTATFVSTDDVEVPASAANGQPFDVQVQGDLTLHGVTTRVAIPVKGQLLPAGLEVVGSLRFPMSLFAIDPPNIGGFVTVDPEATLEFKILMKQG